MNRYKSKVDLWLLFIPIIIVVFVTVMAGYNGDFNYVIFINIPIVLIILGLFLNTYYDVTDSMLKIRSSGFFKLDIPISKIKKISETRSILSSPASSLDRIKITYNKYDTVMISPKNKTEFINKLLEINSSIEVNIKNK